MLVGIISVHFMFLGLFVGMTSVSVSDVSAALMGFLIICFKPKSAKTALKSLFSCFKKFTFKSKKQDGLLRILRDFRKHAIQMNIEIFAKIFRATRRLIHNSHKETL